MTKTVTVDPEVAVKDRMVMVTFQKKKWRWIWNLKEKNLRMLIRRDAMRQDDMVRIVGYVIISVCSCN